VALLAFAGLELAELRPCLENENDLLWGPTPKLYAHSWKLLSDSPVFACWLKNQFRKPRICEELRRSIKFMIELTKARGSTNHLSRDALVAATLWGFESMGDAIAYQDAQGHLAWRASPDFLNYWNEEN